MKLIKLKLNNFKNYSSCSLNFNPRFNFIYGDNGNGKTNILEAISFLCYTKSFLQNPEINCIKFGEKFFDITSEFYDISKTQLKVRFSFEGDSLKKEINFNNELVQRFNSFFGTFPLVCLSPADIKLTAGSPNDKRRNFDILISQVSKTYFNDLKNINKVIKQKNKLLKDNILFSKYSNFHLKELLEPWNEKLVDLSVNILLKRLDFLNDFQSYISKTFYEILNDKAIPSITYDSEVILDNGEENNEGMLRENYHNVLFRKMDLEISRGISLVGPHRDNYIFNMMKDGENFDVRNYASQGEHKTFIVALKISEFHYLKDKLNNSNSGEPIILLDDLFSEVDSNRTEKIASMLTGLKQIFLTTTDRKYLDIANNYFSKSDISSYYIINGTVTAS